MTSSDSILDAGKPSVGSGGGDIQGVLVSSLMSTLEISGETNDALDVENMGTDCDALGGAAEA